MLELRFSFRSHFSCSDSSTDSLRAELRYCGSCRFRCTRYLCCCCCCRCCMIPIRFLNLVSCDHDGLVELLPNWRPAPLPRHFYGLEAGPGCCGSCCARCPCSRCCCCCGCRCCVIPTRFLNLVSLDVVSPAAVAEAMEFSIDSMDSKTLLSLQKVVGWQCGL